MAKPICKAERKGKWFREEARFICCTRFYVKWTKNFMARARRRYNKKLCEENI